MINNIAEVLEVCHSSYEKLKKKNNQQKDEHNMVQVGIASISKCTAMKQEQKIIMIGKDLGNDKSATFRIFEKNR